MDIINLDPLDFWYRGIGQYLHSAVSNESNPAIVALSRNHAHAANAGSAVRLGGGKAMSLVTETGCVLMADIKPCRQPPASTVIHDGSWRTIPNWIAEIVLSPPASPFMVVIHGKDWNTIHNWRINYGSDVISLSGVETATINRALVAGLYADLDGIAPMQWRAAARALERRKRNHSEAESIDAEIDAMIVKCPALDAVIDRLPAVGSDDFNMLSLLCGDREKNEG
jgi:hypothetical protein